MRTEKEVEEMYDNLKVIAPAIHKSLLFFAEWVLEIGEEQKFFAQDMKGLADARRRMRD